MHNVSLSIIIPVREGETAHKDLVCSLNALQDSQLEVIVTKGNSRANAMNKGVLRAQNKFLWFVHADTKVEKTHINVLKKSCYTHPESLHYFDLSFAKDGPFLSLLNAWGANIRSRVLSLPWGDQAFCCSQEVFQKIGPYDEAVTYGEDHLLVWSAHHKNIQVKSLRETIETSAREYQKKGWLALTLKRQYLWLKQALPQLWTLIKKRIKPS